jgi:alpha-1,2-mannosyltransferase
MVMLAGGRPGRSAAVVAAAARLAPALILLLLAATSLAILGAAGSTLGYDFQAYVQAADRLMVGQPLYDPAVDVAGAFAIYLYPPPFALAVIPFAALPDPAGTWAWLAFLVSCFLGGTAVLPVRPAVRWTVVALAALSLPFLYGLKLGQVSPILYLCFAIGWRSLDRAVPLGLSTVTGTLIKVQPIILFGWMLVTRRWTALAVGGAALLAALALTTLLMGAQVWSDYLALLARVSQPITTPHNMTPGAVAFRAGLSTDVATVVQYAAMALTATLTLFAWLRRDAATGFMVGVVASQLLSPLLWDHYAMLLLLPTALLLQRGHWWAAALPLLPWLPADAVYPMVFGAALLGPILTSERRRTW